MLVDDVWHLADTGYGSGLLFPVPLVDGLESTQGGWTFRTVLLADGGWQLHELRSGHWFTHYTVPPEDTFLVDVVAANWVDVDLADVPVHPAARRPAQGRGRCAHMLTGRELVVESPAGRSPSPRSPTTTWTASCGTWA